MSDPVEITQQVTTHGQQAGAAVTGLGAVALIIGSATKLWRVVFGTPKERAEAKVAEADAAARLVDAAADVIDAQREDTQRVRAERDATANERDDCQAQLRELREQTRADRAQAARDRQRIADLEEETQACARNSEWMERALIAVVANEPIPPKPDPTPRNPHPNIVRAAVELARKETP